MKIGSKLQYECPDKCPDNCPIKPSSFYQGCTCFRCPVLVCAEPKTKEDEYYMPMILKREYRDDWAREWDLFFKDMTHFPKLQLTKETERS